MKKDITDRLLEPFSQDLNETGQLLYEAYLEILALRAKVKKLDDSNTNLGWALNPDRMGQ